MADDDFTRQDEKDALRPSRGVIAGVALGVCAYALAGLAWLLLSGCTPDPAEQARRDLSYCTEWSASLNAGKASGDPGYAYSVPACMGDRNRGWR
jgi:hypothetical protein